MPNADANGARLYYEVHGEGQPLLLIPGFGSTVEIYVANAPALAERFRVIVFDPRGAGRSDVPQPATSYSMQQFAEDCAAVLDAAGAESAHVFGTSFGGMVAQHLALLYPERVRRMVLGCTTPGGVAHVTPPPEQIATFLAASGIADPAAAVRSTYPLHYSDAFIAGHDEEIVARSQRNAHLRSTPEGRAGQLNAVSGHDTWERLPELRAPVFVAHGEEDGVVPVQNARNLASQIPGARLKIYPQAKHIFFIECADELNDDIAAFFTEERGVLKGVRVHSPGFQSVAGSK